MDEVRMPLKYINLIELETLPDELVSKVNARISAWLIEFGMGVPSEINFESLSNYLRERSEKIPLLIAKIIKRFNEKDIIEFTALNVLLANIIGDLDNADDMYTSIMEVCGEEFFEENIEIINSHPLGALYLIRSGVTKLQSESKTSLIQLLRATLFNDLLNEGDLKKLEFFLENPTLLLEDSVPGRFRMHSDESLLTYFQSILAAVIIRNCLRLSTELNAKSTGLEAKLIKLSQYIGNDSFNYYNNVYLGITRQKLLWILNNEFPNLQSGMPNLYAELSKALPTELSRSEIFTLLQTYIATGKGISEFSMFSDALTNLMSEKEFNRTEFKEFSTLLNTIMLTFRGRLEILPENIRKIVISIIESKHFPPEVFAQACNICLSNGFVIPEIILDKISQLQMEEKISMLCSDSYTLSISKYGDPIYANSYLLTSILENGVTALPTYLMSRISLTKHDTEALYKKVATLYLRTKLGISYLPVIDEEPEISPEVLSQIDNLDILEWKNVFAGLIGYSTNSVKKTIKLMGKREMPLSEIIGEQATSSLRSAILKVLPTTADNLPVFSSIYFIFDLLDIEIDPKYISLLNRGVNLRISSNISDDLNTKILADPANFKIGVRPGSTGNFTQFMLSEQGMDIYISDFLKDFDTLSAQDKMDRLENLSAELDLLKTNHHYQFDNIPSSKPYLYLVFSQNVTKRFLYCLSRVLQIKDGKLTCSDSADRELFILSVEGENARFELTESGLKSYMADKDFHSYYLLSSSEIDKVVNILVPGTLDCVEYVKALKNELLYSFDITNLHRIIYSTLLKKIGIKDFIEYIKFLTTILPEQSGSIILGIIEMIIKRMYRPSSILELNESIEYLVQLLFLNESEEKKAELVRIFNRISATVIRKSYVNDHYPVLNTIFEVLASKIPLDIDNLISYLHLAEHPYKFVNAKLSLEERISQKKAELVKMIAEIKDDLPQEFRNKLNEVTMFTPEATIAHIYLHKEGLSEVLIQKIDAAYKYCIENISNLIYKIEVLQDIEQSSLGNLIDYFPEEVEKVEEILNFLSEKVLSQPELKDVINWKTICDFITLTLSKGIAPDRILELIDIGLELFEQVDAHYILMYILQELPQIPVANLKNNINILIKMARSPIPEIQRASQGIIGFVLTSPNPAETYQTIETIFSKDNTPYWTRALRIFEAVYGYEQLKVWSGIRRVNDKVEQSSESRISNRRTNLILNIEKLRAEADSIKLTDSEGAIRLQEHASLLEFRLKQDLALTSLRVSLRSGDEEFRKYLLDLESINDDLGHIESHSLERIVERLIAITIPYGRTMSRNGTTREKLDLVLNTLNLKSKNNDIEDCNRIIRFLAFRLLGKMETDGKPVTLSNYIGYLLNYMNVLEASTESRRKAHLVEVNGKWKLKVPTEGDMLKGVPATYSIPDHGFYPIELLGANANDMGLTPNGVSYSSTPANVDGDFKSIIETSLASQYSGGHLIAIAYKDDRFQLDEGVSASINQTVIYNRGLETEWNWEGGLGLHDIDALVVSEKVIRDDIAFQAVKFHWSVKKGVYLPMVDIDGNLIFTEDEYKSLRRDFEGLKYYKGEPLQSSLDEFSEVDKYKEDIENEVNELTDASYVDYLQNTYAQVRMILEKSVRESLINLHVDNTDLSIFDAVLMESGSSGRGTQVKGSSDYDFHLQVNSLDFQKIDLLIDVLRNNLGPEVKVLKGQDRGNYVQIRIFGIKIGEDIIDLDLGVFLRKDGSNVKPHEVIEAKFDSLLGQYPEGERGKRLRQLQANIILAKKLLKEKETYKRFYKGVPIGLGGIGVETWVLANGGSVYKAFKTFWEAAHDGSNVKSFEEFRESYRIINVGSNIRDDNYVDFLRDCLSEEGYRRMLLAIGDYLQTEEVQII